MSPVTPTMMKYNHRCEIRSCRRRRTNGYEAISRDQGTKYDKFEVAQRTAVAQQQSPPISMWLTGPATNSPKIR